MSDRIETVRATLGAIAQVGLETPVELRTNIHVQAMRGYALTRMQESIAHLLGAVTLLEEAGLPDASNALLILALDVAKVAPLIPGPEAFS